MTSINDQYFDQYAASNEMWERSRNAIVGGITHDGRHIKPFPPYMAKADGGYKWSIEGHKLIDFCVGHGSLIFGHNDPDLTAAMVNQVAKGTHFSAGHEAEIRWAEAVNRVVPSAELTRFTGSGTESTLLAMRIARGATGKDGILKFEGHFHGWQDYALKGEKPPFEKGTVNGVPNETLTTVSVLPANELAMLEERLVQGDIAAVIMEPSGGSWTTMPLAADFLQSVRDLCDKYGAILIFDEVITGFRWAPGGAQERFGVTPDITTMAKIVAGGMPGGAVSGKADIMSVVAFSDDPAKQAKKVPQMGTYNANPLAAAAGAKAVEKCADPAVQQYCDDIAVKIRSGMNEILVRHDAPGFVWGESSVFHIAFGARPTNMTAGDLAKPEGVSPEFLKKSGGTPLGMKTEIGMLLEGVHVFHSGGLTCIRHTDEDVANTLQGFEIVVKRMKDEGDFAGK